MQNIKDKRIISYIIFSVLMIIIFVLSKAFFYYDDFFNHYNAGKDIIFWQNRVMDMSLIGIYISGLICIYHNRMKSIFPIALIIIIVAFTLMKLSVLYFSIYTPEKWSLHPESRYLMIEDIKKNYTLVGMSSEEVEYLFGLYDDRDEISENVEQYLYLIQDNSWLLAASKDYLVIQLEDEIVTDYELINYRE